MRQMLRALRLLNRRALNTTFAVKTLSFAQSKSADGRSGRISRTTTTSSDDIAVIAHNKWMY